METGVTRQSRPPSPEGVDFLERCLGDLGESLGDNRVHSILEALR